MTTETQQDPIQWIEPDVDRSASSDLNDSHLIGLPHV